MKRLLSVFWTFFAVIGLLSLSSGVGAQTANYYLGSTSHNEVGVRVRPLPDGSAIIAGYTYDGSKVMDADMLLLKVIGGSIVWCKKWGTANANDLIQDMTITANGDIVVVSSEENPTTKKKMGCIYRFDGGGHLLNQNRTQYITQSGADQSAPYSGVCETANGKIIAVGTVDGVSGLVVTFTPSLSYVYHEILISYEGDHSTFTGVVPDVYTAGSDGVIICGGYSEDYLHATLFRYIPPPAYSPGTFSSITMFDIKEGLTKRFSVFTQIHYAYTAPGTNRNNDRLILTGAVSGDEGQTINSKQFSFQSDPFGNGAKVKLFNNANTFTNTSRIYPVEYDPGNNDFSAMITENPASVSNDPVLKADAAVLDGVVSDIASLKFNTIDYSRNFYTATGIQHSVLDIWQIPFSIGTITHVTGSVNNGGHSEKNIYYSEFNPVFNKITNEPSPCAHTDHDLEMETIDPVRYSPEWTTGKQYGHEQHELNTVDYDMGPQLICGAAPPVNCAILKLKAIVTPGEHGDCYFYLTATASPAAGWTVVGYYWTSTTTFPSTYYDVNTTNISHWGFILPNGSSTSVSVTVYLVNAAGDTCEVMTGLSYVCNDDPGHKEVPQMSMGPEQTAFSHGIQIFPNPARDRITIRSDRALELIQIRDLTGREVLRMDPGAVQEISLPVTALPPGIYIVFVNGVVAEKVIKEE